MLAKYAIKKAILMTERHEFNYPIVIRVVSKDGYRIDTHIIQPGKHSFNDIERILIFTYKPLKGLMIVRPQNSSSKVQLLATIMALRKRNNLAMNDTASQKHLMRNIRSYMVGGKRVTLRNFDVFHNLHESTKGELPLEYRVAHDEKEKCQN